MSRKTQIAKNPETNRFYRVDMMQMRYFPVAKTVALAKLADGSAVEVAYLPFGRNDLIEAYLAADEALKAIMEAA